jgi:hypothetical protein
MRWGATVCAVVVAACGGDSSGSFDVDARFGCAAGSPTAEGYLPFDVGNSWRYRSTDADDPSDISTKRQELTEEVDGFIVQETQRGGSVNLVVSRFQPVGDAIVRFERTGYDDATLDSVTYYEPDGKIRLDESPDRIAPGASWEATHTKRVIRNGVEVSTQVTEAWTIYGVDVPCASPAGEFECLHYERARSDGDTGFIRKEFWYARGVGKIREQGGRIEELLDCNLQ